LIYGLTKKFKRGCTICLYTTYRCNLACPYCINYLLVGKTTGEFYCPEVTPSKWYNLINDFPVPVKEVILSGGEPMLYFQIDELIHALLNTGVHVVIFTNGTVRKRLSVKSHRFRIQMTLHESCDRKVFYDNVAYYKRQYPVHIERFGDKEKRGVRTIKTSEKDIAICRNLKRFKFTPDGRLWMNDNELSDTYWREK